MVAATKNKAGDARSLAISVDYRLFEALTECHNIAFLTGDTTTLPLPGRLPEDEIVYRFDSCGESFLTLPDCLSLRRLEYYPTELVRSFFRVGIVALSTE